MGAQGAPDVVVFGKRCDGSNAADRVEGVLSYVQVVKILGKKGFVERKSFCGTRLLCDWSKIPEGGVSEASVCFKFGLSTNVFAFGGCGFVW